jgi:hypothetical protein
MTKHRAFVVGLGLAAIVISGLYPPWIQQIRQVNSTITLASYGWLWSPPFGSATIGDVVIDWQRVLITWAVIAAATACLFILMPYLAKIPSISKGKE